jgi:hypothetical protein
VLLLNHTLQFTTPHHTLKSSQPAVSSPVLSWRFPTADISLPLGSRTVPLPQVPASNSNSSQGLNRCSPLTNLLTNHFTPFPGWRPLATISHQPFILPTDVARLSFKCWILSLVLRLTVSRPVYLGIKHPTGAYDQIFIAVRQLLVCWCGALSLPKGRICRLQLFLVLASTDIFGSDSPGIRDHKLLSQIRGFHFRRLLRLAGLRWRYSTPPPHGRLSSNSSWSSLYSLGTGRKENAAFMSPFIFACMSVAAIS